MKFLKVDNLLLVVYGNGVNIEWVHNKIDSEGSIRLKQTFTFKKEDTFNDFPQEHGIDPEYEAAFVLATLEGDYYKFKRDILNISVNLYMHKSIDFHKKMFVAHYNISVFRKINFLVNEDIVIGHNENEIPVSVFNTLIKNFPNSTELQKYSSARISTVLHEYFYSIDDTETNYNTYMNNHRISHKGENLLATFAEQEKYKFLAIQNKLKAMLENEVNYSERQWQNEILEIIQLIYPKYVRAFDEVSFKDLNNKTKRLDFLLIDSNGNIDIAEIKKPFDKSVVSHRKYRDNHIPLRELSGSVMQVEKYLYFLNKMSIKGEEKLNKQYGSKLPTDLSIKINNPNGMIIMGREKDLTKEQLSDFEIIKRQYKNVIDIFTYDDLIRRLEISSQKFIRT